MRFEHNHTLLVRISDEAGSGWTTVTLDRGTQEWSVAQRDTQPAAAEAAHEALYRKAPEPGRYAPHSRGDDIVVAPGGDGLDEKRSLAAAAAATPAPVRCGATRQADRAAG